MRCVVWRGLPVNAWLQCNGDSIHIRRKSGDLSSAAERSAGFNGLVGVKRFTLFLHFAHGYA